MASRKPRAGGTSHARIYDLLPPTNRKVLRIDGEEVEVLEIPDITLEHVAVLQGHLDKLAEASKTNDVLGMRDAVVGYLSIAAPGFDATERLKNVSIRQLGVLVRLVVEKVDEGPLAESSPATESSSESEIATAP